MIKGQGGEPSEGPSFISKIFNQVNIYSDYKTYYTRRDLKEKHFYVVLKCGKIIVMIKSYLRELSKSEGSFFFRREILHGIFFDFWS